jgi:uncharacterized protein YacL
MKGTIFRILFIIILILAGAFLSIERVKGKPQETISYEGALYGLLIGLVVIFLETRFRKIRRQDFLLATIGVTLGIVLAFFINVSLFVVPFFSFSVFPKLAVTLVCVYLSVAGIFAKREEFTFIDALFRKETEAKNKVIDTSAIIDGRIADIIDAGFIEGKIFVPKFVLQELQYIADSPDPLKRNRGKRGLEILNRIQEIYKKNIEIMEKDYPNIKEINGKIITTDYNLNKVAKLQGIEIINVNDLANAVKPIVLPGENMRIKIVKEGKEYNQGVGFLDDGTMVVVENAKYLIGQTIDIVVVSVLQQPSGKIIFAKRMYE